MGTCLPSQADSVFGSVTQTVIMTCTVDEAVGDLVRQDLAVNDKVVKATNNAVNRPIIGRIAAKQSDTVCEVILMGVIAVSGFGDRGRVFLSSVGGFTVSIPAPGSGEYMQELGYSYGDGRVHFKPSQIVIKR